MYIMGGSFLFLRFWEVEESQKKTKKVALYIHYSVLGMCFLFQPKNFCTFSGQKPAAFSFRQKCKFRVSSLVFFSNVFQGGTRKN